MSYPKWADIADLVARLGKRKHPDCTAAAIKLEDMQAGLHNRTAELELAERRLAILGSLIERAAAQSREERNDANELVGISLPSPVWFQLLSCYRTQSDGQTIYGELKLLREIAGVAVETLRSVDDWLGHASTREAAMESLWRLTRILERAGFQAPHEHLAWRGQIIRALEEAGLGLGDDGRVRLRSVSDRYWEPASGPLIIELLGQLPTTVRVLRNRDLSA
jgi:hypothetical protein